MKSSAGLSTLHSRRRLCCLRRETALSPESAAGSSEAGFTEVLSALFLGGAQIVGGVLELAYYRAAGDGQAFPTRERHRVLD